MIEQLVTFIENLKGNPNIAKYDEASTKQAIILPIFQMLGWNIFDIGEVMPEFSSQSGRVDYSLKHDGSNKVFVEAKKPSEDLEHHEEQLLEYSFSEGVEIAALTNGITWWFYLPTQKGDWKERKFFTIDLIQQEPRDAQRGLWLSAFWRDLAEGGQPKRYNHGFTRICTDFFRYLPVFFLLDFGLDAVQLHRFYSAIGG